ncbi:MAG: recombinase family protein [Candidatus Marinimicrobia bacterium]|jgi:DNA invertase Pin-like site-specific DNA recombinase|nr:recombinase family protein [Candidatus Neomarinimicrobiota bacterium]
MNIGYARVSTQDQNLDLQNDALNNAGCEKIYTDKMSGAKTDRPGLEKILGFIRKGDTLVVWKLDRLGRSLKHLIQVMQLLDGRGVYFRSVQESLDTSTPGGKLIFHVFGALAEFERDIIRERTLAGLAAARSRGRVGGRPRKLSKKQVEMAKNLMNDISIPIAEICETLGVSKATLYRSVNNT